jgi:membrane-bound serine protease (ClpP class)
MIIFSINTFGGRVDSALQIATLIGSLDDIRTVAYIPADPESLGVSWSAGALISFSCNQIYMAPGTSIGAAAPVFQSAEGTQAAGEKTVSAVRTQLAALAEKNGYPKEVAIAMVDQDAELVEVRRDGTIEFQISGAEETGDTGQAGGGTEGDSSGDDSNGGTEAMGTGTEPRRTVVSPSGKLLTLTAGEMEEYGISSGTVPSVEELGQILGLSRTERVVPTGADQVVGFLTSAAVTSMLLTIGLLALYLEISSPGFGLPGTLAVIAFALIFISGGLLGTLGSVELILFLLGVVLLVVEIFLIPGFGVAGISGLLMMSAGLILSRQGFVLPDSDWQWDIFLQNLGVVFGTFALSFILMGILMMFFPRIRLFNRLILSTSSGPGVGASPEGSVGSSQPAGSGTHGTGPRSSLETAAAGSAPGAAAQDSGAGSGTPGGSGHGTPKGGAPGSGAESGAPDGGAESGTPGSGAGRGRFSSDRYPHVGSTGTVRSTLRPAGRVDIGGEIYSVVTEGEWIEAGEQVRVIEVAGNRIVVERSQ